MTFEKKDNIIIENVNQLIVINLIFAGMAELADAMDLGSIGFFAVQVQVLLPAETNQSRHLAGTGLSLGEKGDLNLSNPEGI